MILPAQVWDNHYHASSLDITGHMQVTQTCPMTTVQAPLGVKDNKRNVDTPHQYGPVASLGGK